MKASFGIKLFAAGVIVLFAFTPKCEQERFKPDRLTALIISREFIKKQLKAPSSAKFNSDIESVKQVDESTFIINGWVDSQNSFGAMLRNTYHCKLKYKGDMATCEEIKIGE